MRRLIAIFALLGLGASAPAWADVTLRYRAVMPQTATAEARANAPAMTIEADDAGQARIEMAAPGAPAGGRAPSVALITREGVGYLALAGPQPGQEIVARQEDALALLTPMAAGLAAGSARDGVQEAMRQRVEIVPVGAESVAGVRGNLYRVVIVSGETRSPPLDIVLSSDPRLATAGRELVRLVDSLRPTLVAVTGGEPRVFGAVRALLGMGVPLRIGNAMVLDSVSTADVPDSRFVLPGRVWTREQLGQMMAAMMPARPPAGQAGPVPVAPPTPGTAPPNPQ